MRAPRTVIMMGKFGGRSMLTEERIAANDLDIRAGWIHLPHLPEVAAFEECLGASSISWRPPPAYAWALPPSAPTNGHTI